MGFITLDEVIATAQSTIKDADSNSKLLWRQWIALMALPNLGIAESDVRVVELIPQEFHAVKPDDCRAIIDVALYDVNNCIIKHIFRAGGERIYPDFRIPRTAVVGPPPDSLSQPLDDIVPVDVSETPTLITLGTNADLVNKILLRYYSMPLDDTGLPLIDQEDLMALVYFTQFMHALREKESPGLIASYKINWEREADKCIARKKMRSVSNEKMKTIVLRVWNRLIPSFSFENY